jgi:hypothetical protein
VDVTYNFVPGGTTATTTGRVCEDGGTLYYKVSFAPEIMEANQITSTNTWIEEEEISPTN